MQNIKDILFCQLESNWGLDSDEKNELEQYIENAIEKTKENILTWKAYRDFSFFNSNHNVLFLYYLRENISSLQLKDKLYCHAKMLHSVDFYGLSKIPNYFRVEHPLGSVVGKAILGNYITLYQQVTIGGTLCGDSPAYPQIGNNVIFYAKSTLLGKAIVGDFVVFSANSFVINEDIPANSYVFGSSPNLTIKPLSFERYHELSNFKME